MSQFGLGLAKGLAVDLQNDKKIADLRYNQEADLRAQKMKEARDEMLFGDLTINGATNEFDAPRIKERGRQIINKLGQYYRENPDMMSNPEKRAYFNTLKAELKDNADLHRGLASDSAYREYIKDLQEGKGKGNAFDSEAYNAYQQQWNNYRKYGNQNGPEALKEQGVQPFVYTRPKDLSDLGVELPKLGGVIKDYDVIPTENGGWYTQAKPGQLDNLKKTAYNQYGREIQLASQKLGLDTPEKVDRWVSDNIQAGFDKSHSLGDPLAIRRLQLQEAELGLHRQKEAREARKDAAGNTIMPWDDLMRPDREYVALPRDVYNKVWPAQPKVVLTGSGGQKAELSGYNFDFDGSIYKPQKGKFKGMPFAVGHIDIPVEEAKEQGIVKNNNWFGDADEVKDWDVVNGFDPKRVVLRKEFNKDSTKSRVIARVLTEVPIDPTDKTARSMFMTATAPAKFYEPYQQQSQQPQMFVDDNGNVFDSNNKYLGKQSDFLD